MLLLSILADGARSGLRVGAAWQHGCGMGKKQGLIVGHLQLGGKDGRKHRSFNPVCPTQLAFTQSILPASTGQAASPSSQVGAEMEKGPGDVGAKKESTRSTSIGLHTYMAAYFHRYIHLLLFCCKEV